MEARGSDTQAAGLQRGRWGLSLRGGVSLLQGCVSPKKHL